MVAFRHLLVADLPAHIFILLYPAPIAGDLGQLYRNACYPYIEREVIEEWVGFLHHIIDVKKSVEDFLTILIAAGMDDLSKNLRDSVMRLPNVEM